MLAFVPLVVACGGPEPKTARQQEDGVPANSLSESRLKGEEKPIPARPVSETPEGDDPTSPLTTPIEAAPAAGVPADPKPGAPAKPGKSGPKVSSAECARLFDRYIELEFDSNPQLQGLPPDMRKQIAAQAKAQAKAQKGEAPCDATRSQYACGMAATSTSEWKKCLQ